MVTGKGRATMMGSNGWDVGHWLEMTFMMLVFWTLFIGLVLWVVRDHRSP
jgi:hypothetical protein